MDQSILFIDYHSLAILDDLPAKFFVVIFSINSNPKLFEISFSLSNNSSILFELLNLDNQIRLMRISLVNY